MEFASYILTVSSGSSHFYRYGRPQRVHRPHLLLLSGPVSAQFPLGSLRPKSMLPSLTVCAELRLETRSVNRIPPYVPCLIDVRPY